MAVDSGRKDHLRRILKAQINVVISLFRCRFLSGDKYRICYETDGQKAGFYKTPKNIILLL